MNAASLAAFVVAKRLLSDEPGIDTAPSPLRAPLTSARTRLLRARDMPRRRHVYADAADDTTNGFIPADEARDALAQFIREAVRQGWRCLRVVHGKGLGSPGREPVLKAKVQRWLVQKQQVLAFVQAKPAEGGAGALVVLLR